jgi:hypothetical protein
MCIEVGAKLEQQAIDPERSSTIQRISMVQRERGFDSVKDPNVLSDTTSRDFKQRELRHCLWLLTMAKSQ